MSSACRRVLVIEDDRVINQAVSDRLEAEGYEVARAWDGPGAVAAYGEHSPDLVVLDVMLPGYDGHEVCRRIQADRPVEPVGQHGGGGLPRGPWIVAFEHERQTSGSSLPSPGGHLLIVFRGEERI